MFIYFGWNNINRLKNINKKKEHIYVYNHILFSILISHKVLNTVPCVI